MGGILLFTTRTGKPRGFVKVRLTLKRLKRSWGIVIGIVRYDFKYERAVNTQFIRF